MKEKKCAFQRLKKKKGNKLEKIIKQTNKRKIAIVWGLRFTQTVSYRRAGAHWPWYANSRHWLREYGNPLVSNDFQYSALRLRLRSCKEGHSTLAKTEPDCTHSEDRANFGWSFKCLWNLGYIGLEHRFNCLWNIEAGKCQTFMPQKLNRKAISSMKHGTKSPLLYTNHNVKNCYNSKGLESIDVTSLLQGWKAPL